MATMRSSISLFHPCLIFLHITYLTCYAQSSSSFTLKQGQSLRASNASGHLLSSNGVFKLGFFKPGVTSIYNQSRYSYLAIWYANLPNNPEAVWVANRGDPILDSSGVLTLDSDGNLKITRRDAQAIVLNSNAKVSGLVAAYLLDSGNFVLSKVTEKGEMGRVLWQSFDHPTDTLLPRMKLGLNLKAGQKSELSSWLTGQVPYPGVFRLGVDPGEANQLVLWRREEVYWTSGVWKNGSFRNALSLTKRDDLFEFRFVSNEVEKYFTYSARNSSTLARWEVNFLGQIMQFVLDKNSVSSWESEVTNPCEPMKYPETICVGLKSTQCRSGPAVFVKKRGTVKTYNSLYFTDNTKLSLTDCQAACWKDCNCVCATTFYPNGTACVLIKDFADLIFDESSSTYAYFPTLRGAIETPNEEGIKRDSTQNTTKKWWLWCIIAVSIAAAMIVLYCFYNLRKRKLRLSQEAGTSENAGLFEPGSIFNADRRGKMNKNYELFSFSLIESSTENFSVSNKLGEGGFGPVYKGTLPDGQEIAIKRLARSSGQGLQEFMNEITLIAELQHTNLVRLIGCCVQGEEKMLVYEYMPNKSLDCFLFDVDPAKRKLLDWRKRFDIIDGIAQGILYLHKYSRLRIIHRDLKASNILLDQDMNPKISDFGLARIFGRDESTLNTRRIVGTYGYMPPEYAMNGIFSVKSDVYSFGILLLEIVSGKKNNSFSASSAMSPLELAWDLWRKGETRTLVDNSVGDSCPEEELVKRIHIGLLCVQERADDRPTMSAIIAMLSNDATNLPEPKQPSYCGRSSQVALPSGLEWASDVASTNSLTLTMMEPR